MEDFISLIWVLLIGGGAIFSAIKSEQRKRRQKAERAVRHPEAPAEAGMFSVREQPAERRPAESPDDRYRLKTPPVQNDAPQMQNTLRDEDKTASSEEADAPALTDDFDLRKAVIYSELLKPKFED